jgi:hypothetical protein
MIWTVAYVAGIVGVNVAFAVVPYLGSLVVGGLYCLRDAAHRSVGNWVLAASVAGIGISYVMADPFVARASALAFALGTAADFLTYEAARRAGLPFRSRVLVSALVSAPVDTVAFLGGWGLGILSPDLFVIQVVSKLAAAVAIRWWPRRTLEVA